MFGLSSVWHRWLTGWLKVKSVVPFGVFYRDWTNQSIPSAGWLFKTNMTKECLQLNPGFPSSAGFGRYFKYFFIVYFDPFCFLYLRNFFHLFILSFFSFLNSPSSGYSI
jgi:hypothetical protein